MGCLILYTMLVFQSQPRVCSGSLTYTAIPRIARRLFRRKMCYCRLGNQKVISTHPLVRPYWSSIVLPRSFNSVVKIIHSWRPQLLEPKDIPGHPQARLHQRDFLHDWTPVRIITPFFYAHLTTASWFFVVSVGIPWCTTASHALPWIDWTYHFPGQMSFRKWFL